MKEFKEKLIGRLKEELGKVNFEKATQEVNEPFHDGLAYAYGYSISIVNQLAEEYNGGWIPCSERLPESGVHVLCYGKNSLGSFKYEVSVYAEEIECWMCSKIADVIAWQPLPPAWKGESNGQN